MPLTDEQKAAVLALVDARIQHARDMLAAAPNWSASQAEWSRARDLGLFIRDDIDAMPTKDHPNG